jgi:hypothetical protein
MVVRLGRGGGVLRTISTLAHLGPVYPIGFSMEHAQSRRWSGQVSDKGPYEDTDILHTQQELTVADNPRLPQTAAMSWMK